MNNADGLIAANISHDCIDIRCPARLGNAHGQLALTSKFHYWFCRWERFPSIHIGECYFYITKCVNSGYVPSGELDNVMLCPRYECAHPPRPKRLLADSGHDAISFGKTEIARDLSCPEPA
jgi:hypothetical protein